MRFHFTASGTPISESRLASLSERYGQTDMESCDIIVALGGDGHMLKALKASGGKPVFGMNCGTIGFLMNDYRTGNLARRIKKAEQTVIHPLLMEVVDIRGETHTGHGINEVSLIREGHQAAKIKIEVDGISRLDEMFGDGLIVATPAGSTAYNLSAHGPIIPLGAEILALTPVSAFRPRRWRGALLPIDAEVVLTILEPEFRPVLAASDSHVVRDAARVSVRLDRSISYTILSDAGNGLAERAMREQFQLG